MDFPLTAGTFAAAAAVVAVGYLIFAITGFGASLLTVPVLSHLLPLPFVLPLTVLLDVAASLTMGVRFRSDADKTELKLMVPASLAGAVLGVTLLVSLPQQAALAGLAIVIAAYGVYSLRPPGEFRPVSRRWAPVSGAIGGSMGTLFGIGAPPYAVYLSRRIHDKMAMRATLSTMVLASTGIRLTVFIVAGLVLTDRLIAFAALVPFMLVGLWAGTRVHLTMSREKILTAISIVLILSGGSLLVRVLTRY